MTRHAGGDSSGVEQVPDNINFPKSEIEILKYWKEIDAFQSSLKQSKGDDSLMKMTHQYYTVDESYLLVIIKENRCIHFTMGLHLQLENLIMVIYLLELSRYDSYDSLS